MDIEKIKENYKNFDDERIIKIIKKNLSILNPQTMSILKEEAEKRNIPEKLIQKIESANYNSELKQTEFYGYLNVKYAQLNNDSIEIVLPCYGKWIFLIKSITNTLPKLKISYDNIDYLYKGYGDFNLDSGYTVVFSEYGKKKEKATMLNLLSEKELILLVRILKSKGVKIYD